MLWDRIVGDNNIYRAPVDIQIPRHKTYTPVDSRVKNYGMSTGDRPSVSPNNIVHRVQ